MPNQLYLPDWTVKHTTIEDDRYIVPASYDIAPEACLKCGVVGNLYRHGTKLITYVDAPVHGRQTFIKVRRGRYKCRDCGGTFMQPLPDMNDERRMTNRCVDYIEKQCLLKPNTHVAEDVGIDEKVVRQIGRRARSLFGKRPGRVKAELAAKRAAMIECASCKALFEPSGLKAPHIKGSSKPIDNGLPLCPDCSRFHTQTWFNHGRRSTSKSE